ncbi:hypothetical protein CRUP_011653, partial [Coryphaenoides rupestris]
MAIQSGRVYWPPCDKELGAGSLLGPPWRYRASRQFDQEGRKKFFTLDMNNILLDIELQVQEQPDGVRSAVYSHLEAFVPCNKEALLKRLKKLSLNIQDDRLRTPLLKLKLAVCSVMPEQIGCLGLMVAGGDWVLGLMVAGGDWVLGLMVAGGDWVLGLMVAGGDWVLGLMVAVMPR